MNLRTITIWTTALMLIVAIFAPFLNLGRNFGGFAQLPIPIEMIIPTIFGRLIISLGMAIFFLLLTGSPLVVSLIIARKLKPFIVPNFILLVSTIVYAMLFSYWWSLATDGGSCMNGIFVCYIAPSSLPVMIPVWIIAVVLNRHYVKKVTAAMEPKNLEDK